MGAILLIVVQLNVRMQDSSTICLHDLMHHIQHKLSTLMLLELEFSTNIQTRHMLIKQLL